MQSIIPVRRRFAAPPAFLFVALLMLAGPLPARACDLCAIYTGSLMQSSKTGLQLGIAEQYTSFETIRVDGEKEPNEENEWIHSSITQVLAGYSFTSRIGIQLNVPFVSREFRRLEEGVPTRGDATGIGDLSILGRFSPLSRSFGGTLVHTELFAGLKFPTGDSHRLGEEDDEHGDGHEEETDDHIGADSLRMPRHGDEEQSAVHGHDLAEGSGSYDGLFGASVHASWRRVFGELAVQYVVRGNGDHSYEYANDLTWEAALGYYVLVRDNWTGSLSIVTSGENKGRDHHDGELENDTAITAVYLGPGAVVTWTDSLHADFVIEGPLEEDNTGRQLVPNYRIRGGLVWRF